MDCGSGSTMDGKDISKQEFSWNKRLQKTNSWRINHQKTISWGRHHPKKTPCCRRSHPTNGFLQETSSQRTIFWRRHRPKTIFWKRQHPKTISLFELLSAGPSRLRGTIFQVSCFMFLFSFCHHTPTERSSRFVRTHTYSKTAIHSLIDHKCLHMHEHIDPFVF